MTQLMTLMAQNIRYVPFTATRFIALESATTLNFKEEIMETIIRWLIKTFLRDMHLHHDPTPKKKDADQFAQIGGTATQLSDIYTKKENEDV